MRNIAKSEQSILVREKLNNGKSEEIAVEEVERDVNFINNLKKEVSQRNQEIRKLEEEKRKADNKWREDFEKLKRSQDRLNKPIKINTKYPTTLHLNRMIHFLEENKDVCVKKICEECCMESNYVKNGLEFFMKFKLVKSERKKNIEFYSLKGEEKL